MCCVAELPCRLRDDIVSQIENSPSPVSSRERDLEGKTTNCLCEVKNRTASQSLTDATSVLRPKVHGASTHLSPLTLSITIRWRPINSHTNMYGLENTGPRARSDLCHACTVSDLSLFWAGSSMSSTLQLEGVWCFGLFSSGQGS